MTGMTATRSRSIFDDPNIRVMFSAEQIATRIKELGAAITADYQQKDLIMIGVLNGSCLFLSDLMREIDLPLEIDFMSVSSYKGMTSTRDVKILKDHNVTIRDRDVLIVEDIIDTGNTLYSLVDLLSSRHAASIKIATFLDKPEPREKTELIVDYTGFVIPNEFVVGYGLDYDGRYRNLPYVGVVNDPDMV